MHSFHFVANVANLFINLRLEVLFIGSSVLPHLVNYFAMGIFRV